MYQFSLPGDLILGQIDLNLLVDVYKACLIRFAKFGGAARRRFHCLRKTRGASTSLCQTGVNVSRAFAW